MSCGSTTASSPIRRTRSPSCLQAERWRSEAAVIDDVPAALPPRTGRSSQGWPERCPADRPDHRRRRRSPAAPGRRRSRPRRSGRPCPPGWRTGRASRSRAPARSSGRESPRRAHGRPRRRPGAQTAQERPAADQDQRDGGVDRQARMRGRAGQDRCRPAGDGPLMRLRGRVPCPRWRRGRRPRRRRRCRRPAASPTVSVRLPGPPAARPARERAEVEQDDEGGEEVDRGVQRAMPVREPGWRRSGIAPRSRPAPPGAFRSRGRRRAAEARARRAIPSEMQREIGESGVGVRAGERDAGELAEPRSSRPATAVVAAVSTASPASESAVHLASALIPQASTTVVPRSGPEPTPAR